jgi:hypothetical protein
MYMCIFGQWRGGRTGGRKRERERKRQGGSREEEGGREEWTVSNRARESGNKEWEEKSETHTKRISFMLLKKCTNSKVLE